MADRIDEIRERLKTASADDYKNDVAFLLDIIDHTIDADIIVAEVALAPVAVPASAVWLMGFMADIVASRVKSEKKT